MYHRSIVSRFNLSKKNASINVSTINMMGKKHSYYSYSEDAESQHLCAIKKIK